MFGRPIAFGDRHSPRLELSVVEAPGAAAPPPWLTLAFIDHHIAVSQPNRHVAGVLTAPPRLRARRFEPTLDGRKADCEQAVSNSSLRARRDTVDEQSPLAAIARSGGVDATVDGQPRLGVSKHGGHDAKRSRRTRANWLTPSRADIRNTSASERTEGPLAKLKSPPPRRRDMTALLVSASESGSL